MTLFKHILFLQNIITTVFLAWKWIVPQRLPLYNYHFCLQYCMNIVIISIIFLIIYVLCINAFGVNLISGAFLRNLLTMYQEYIFHKCYFSKQKYHLIFIISGILTSMSGPFRTPSRHTSCTLTGYICPCWHWQWDNLTRHMLLLTSDIL